MKVFCKYCRRMKPLEGSIVVRHLETGSERRQCADCVELRKQPREVLEALAKQSKGKK